jgi:hypothetical protein
MWTSDEMPFMPDTILTCNAKQDQFRKCHAFSDARDWIVLNEYVRSDHEISGSFD